MRGRLHHQIAEALVKRCGELMDFVRQAGEATTVQPRDHIHAWQHTVIVCCLKHAHPGIKLIKGHLVSSPPLYEALCIPGDALVCRLPDGMTHQRAVRGVNAPAPWQCPGAAGAEPAPCADPLPA